MIAVDTNILIYAHRNDSPHHLIAERRVRGLAAGTGTWAVPWACLHEFFSIVTRPRIYNPPTPLGVALAQMDAWLASPTLILLSESEQHWQTLRAVVVASQITGARIHDARIAVTCLQHGVREFWSADRDFSRFPDLRVVNPLVA